MAQPHKQTALRLPTILLLDRTTVMTASMSSPGTTQLNGAPLNISSVPLVHTSQILVRCRASMPIPDTLYHLVVRFLNQPARQEPTTRPKPLGAPQTAFLQTSAITWATKPAPHRPPVVLAPTRIHRVNCLVSMPRPATTFPW